MAETSRDLINDYLAKTPPEEEWLERLARRYRGMTAEQRLHEMSDLLRWMDSLLGDRKPLREPPLPLWSHRLSPDDGQFV